jgi:hypothetical protein
MPEQSESRPTLAREAALQSAPIPVLGKTSIAQDTVVYALAKVFAGHAPNGTAPDSCGEFAPHVSAIYEAHVLGGTGEAITEAQQQAKHDEAFDAVFVAALEVAATLDTPAQAEPSRQVSRIKQALADASMEDILTSGVRCPGGLIDITDENLGRVTESIWYAVTANTELAERLYRWAGHLAHFDGASLTSLATRDGRILWRGLVNRCSRFTKSAPTKGNVDAFKEVIPPLAMIEDSLKFAPDTIREVTRITDLPVFAPGRAEPLTVGYDADSRVLVTGTLATNPMSVDAALGLILDDLLVDFPFATDADRTNAVALFLTPFVRDMLGATPIFLIDAATPGTGKGLLVDLFHTVWTGKPAPLSGLSLDAEEQRKLITTLLMTAPTAVVFDDVGSLSGHALQRAVTATVWSDRALGANVNMELPVRNLWIATGNNVVLAGDTARRVLLVRLESAEETPSQRVGFKRNEDEIRAWSHTHRAELVSAAVTLVRHGLNSAAAGNFTMGSFPAFARLLGKITSALGLPAFGGNIEAVAERAPSDAADWKNVVRLWWSNHSTERIKATDILALADADKESGLHFDGDSQRARAMAAANYARQKVGQVYDLGEGVKVQLTNKVVRGKQTYALAEVEGKRTTCTTCTTSDIRKNCGENSASVAPENTQGEKVVQVAQVVRSVPSFPLTPTERAIRDRDVKGV